MIELTNTTTVQELARQTGQPLLTLSSLKELD